MGNFFPMMVCGLFAVFWLSFGVLQLPEWQIAASYSATGTSASEGAVSVGYNAAVALYLIVWGFTLFTFFVFTLKTNLVFACIFFFVDVGVWLLTAAYWKVAAGDFNTALKLQKVVTPHSRCSESLPVLLHDAQQSKSMNPCIAPLSVGFWAPSDLRPAVR
jgi:uncharacterized protein